VEGKEANDWIESFLGALDPQVLYGYTYHLYPQCTLPTDNKTVMDPKCLDGIPDTAAHMRQWVLKSKKGSPEKLFLWRVGRSFRGRYPWIHQRILLIILLH